MKYLQEPPRGFILPTVLAMSLTIITIMVTALMLTSASYGGNYDDHYQKLADQAAEAGTAYATACLGLSGHVQSWGPALSRPNLTPNSNCEGANAHPSNLYVYNDSRIRTYFVVGNLDYAATFSAQISSQGFAQTLRPDGSIEKTFTSVQKKIITWPTDTMGQMSASGTNRTCAVVTSQVYCWGYGSYGQLGNDRYDDSDTRPGIDFPSNKNPSYDSAVPVKVVHAPGVMGGKKIVKIFVAQHHSCALSDDGLMYCWGLNNNGQLGIGSNVDSPVPVQVGGLLEGKEVTDIAGTTNTTCAIADGKIYCWGYNNKGQVGRNSTTSTQVPVLVTAGNTATTLPTNYIATALATSGSRSLTMCAIVDYGATTGKAYCWGQNTAGSVGDGTSAPSGTGVNATKLLPTKVDDTGVLSGKQVTSISQDGYASDGSGYAHVCAVADGGVYCWGENNEGQLGNGDSDREDTSVPVEVVANGVLNNKTVQDVQVGLRHSCVRADSGVYCWGINDWGQLGDNAGGGNDDRSLVPVAVHQQAGVLTGSNVISIGAGANRGCAVITDGRTFCWGRNVSGQIGDGTLIDRLLPTESLFLRPIANQYIF